MVRLAPFSAGPTMRKTSAAPGEMPLAISARATGMEAVLHTYIGMPTNSITGNATQSLPSACASKKLGGTKAMISAESASPTNSANATLPNSVPKPYRSAPATRDGQGSATAASERAVMGTGGGSRSERSTKNPPRTPVTAATSGRISANAHPSKE